MKIRPTLYVLLGSLLASSILISCQKDIVDEQYIKLDQVACSFYGSDNIPIEISIKSQPSTWTAKADASWLTADQSENGRTLILTATDNDTDAERYTTVTVIAGDAVQEITVTQLGYNINMPRYRILPTFQYGAVVSPNGRYIGGFETGLSETDEYIFKPIIIDTYEDEKYYCGEFPQSMCDLHQSLAISDSGLLFIADGYNGGQMIFDKDGNYHNLEVDGYVGKPQVQGTAVDGTYWVGFAMKENDESIFGRMYCPLLWINGQVQELKFPDKNFRDEKFVSGIMARGISADGSVIYGTTWDGDDFGMVYWTNFDEKAEYVGKDVHSVTPVTMVMPDGITEYDAHIANGMICTAELLKISPSGKWIAGSYRTETLSENRQKKELTQHAAFYNTQTKTTTIVYDYGESTGTHVTDDGIAFIGLGTLGLADCVAYDLNTETGLGTATEWAYENYGINIPAGVINYINADKTVVFGTYANASAGGVTYNSFYIAPPIKE